MTRSIGPKPRRAARAAVGTLAAAAVVGIIGGSPAANAQTQRVPRPLALKLGVRFPTNSTLKNEIGTTWFYGGLSYDVKQRQLRRNSLVYQAYFDFTMRKPGTAGSTTNYAVGTGDFNDSDKTGRLLGFGPALKWVLAPASARQQSYVGVGVGYYRATVPSFGTVYYPQYGAFGGPIMTGTGIVGNDTATRLGGKVFVGNQGKDGLFGELDYTYVGEVGGIQPGGFGARVGYRF